jgi:hypothetical protein
VGDFLESRWQCGGQGFEPPQLHNHIAHERRPLACENLAGGRSCLSVRCGRWHVKLEQNWSTVPNLAKQGQKFAPGGWLDRVVLQGSLGWPLTPRRRRLGAMDPRLCLPLTGGRVRVCPVRSTAGPSRLAADVNGEAPGHCGTTSRRRGVLVKGDGVVVIRALAGKLAGQVHL